MSQLATAPGLFAEAFDRLDSASPIHALRENAFASFQAMGMPTLRDEAWRYTSVKPITQTTFTAASDANVSASQLTPFLFDGLDAYRLVFVNGSYTPELSSQDALPNGVRVLSIADALRDAPQTITPWRAQRTPADHQAFIALNTAMIEDGAFIHLAKNIVCDRPIHVLCVTSAGGATIVTSPRLLIVAEQNAQATVIEQHAGLDDGARLTNAVTEIIALENANVDYYRVQRENAETFHTSGLLVSQEQDSTIVCNGSTWGGALTRNEVHAALNGTNCDVTFNGLMMTSETQHVDNALRINHFKPHCRSWQYYKSILADESKSIFTGRIYVAEDAQKTDAKQTNKNLLLSPKAHVTTRPQLEIFADDVKCTHGATIGEVEPSQLFYLQARGIRADAARSLLTFAFANEVLQEIRIDAIRRQLERLLLARLPGGDAIRGEL
ncbi:MAG: Fe-S cluster assembly protein SufD [Phycisphaerales bacterium]|nr:Fe-S cluster assembly protein SufD [Phycisphaerales bacterium]